MDYTYKSDDNYRYEVKINYLIGVIDKYDFLYFKSEDSAKRFVIDHMSDFNQIIYRGEIKI